MRLTADRLNALIVQGGDEPVAVQVGAELAAAHSQTVAAVFRKILRQQHFTWADHRAALLRRRMPWYYEHEPRPGMTVIGARLSVLIGR